jgi:hypothetical protein
MKIQVFKNEKEYLTRDYDLTNVSIGELERALYAHCVEVEVNPMNAAVFLPFDPRNEGCVHIIKGTSTHDMSMQDVAIEILKLHGRKA